MTDDRKRMLERIRLKVEASAFPDDQKEAMLDALEDGEAAATDPSAIGAAVCGLAVSVVGLRLGMRDLVRAEVDRHALECAASNRDAPAWRAIRGFVGRKPGLSLAAGLVVLLGLSRLLTMLTGDAAAEKAAEAVVRRVMRQAIPVVSTNTAAWPLARRSP